MEVAKKGSVFEDAKINIKSTKTILSCSQCNEETVMEDFANFHDARHISQDYKIRYALKGTKLWGGYMTDIIKNFPEKSSSKMMSFLKKDKKNNIFFKIKDGSIYFDLPRFVKSQLKFNKISKIDMLNIDTFVKKNNFFSARRSLRLNHADYGRNISIIMIN